MFETIFDILIFLAVIALIWFVLKAVIKAVIAIIILIVLLLIGNYLFGGKSSKNVSGKPDKILIIV